MVMITMFVSFVFVVIGRLFVPGHSVFSLTTTYEDLAHIWLGSAIALAWIGIFRAHHPSYYLRGLGMFSLWLALIATLFEIYMFWHSGYPIGWSWQ
jgi:hypothetical protein